ncbi:hypothetical protein RND71_039550 [Anisodus tanguticus]|uniref:Uncharacterized protein n=1 Tax=Anisodus tanguticus TaxID=243964 RepID=A0AAE1UXP9_9SOLA|nr:hypothetical protein RND71_039550 [Anisodus tanguticus]
MDQQGNGQSPGIGVVTTSTPMLYGAPYHANQMAGPSPPMPAGAQTVGLPASSGQMAQHRLAYQAHPPTRSNNNCKATTTKFPGKSISRN